MNGAPLKTIWDFLGGSDRDVIEEWARSRLSRRDQAALLQRLIQLRQRERQAALDSNLIAGPLRGAGNLYKLRAKGDHQLRPHLCTGPLNHGAEYTLLCGAIEQDDKLIPPDVQDRAIENRAELKPERNYDRRVEHFNFRPRG
jgi:hypothetical protein